MGHLSSISSRLLKAIQVVLLLVSGVFLGLHTLHLRADFPNHSPWMDWSKYTDEGWYGDAAIRHFQRGHWYVPGDFNPAAALPVWPLIESAVFRFTGVGVAPARALTVGIFALILLTSWLLLRRWQSLRFAPRTTGHPLARPSHRGSPTRSQPVLLRLHPVGHTRAHAHRLLTLLALLAASYAEPQRGSNWQTHLRNLLPILALGLLLPLMVLTKTTAIFLLPAIAWLLWARAGYQLRPFLRLGLPPALLAAILWFSYYGLVVHPHFLSDYQYLFSANGYTGITSDNAPSVLRDTIADGQWIGPILYPCARCWPSPSSSSSTSASCVTRLSPRSSYGPPDTQPSSPTTTTSSPRYYLVIAVPLTLLVAIVFESIWRNQRIIAPLHHLAAGLAAAALAVIVISDARQTLHYVRTPEYTFARAASEIHDIVAADHTHNPLVLSISGSNLSLMTGLPSICDDFGTMDLAVRVRAYQPGWYVTWNQVDDDKMDALAPLYRLRRVAAFPAMDDPERNLLILYRLDLASPNTPQRPHHRRTIPRLLPDQPGPAAQPPSSSRKH